MYTTQKMTNIVIITVVAGLLISLFDNQAIADEQRAVQKFKFALNACDRGMNMKMPRSSGSLRILKSRLKRYQYNRNAALALDAFVKDLETEHYTGRFFAEQTSFAEAYHICENDFVEKVANAQISIDEKIAARQARQKELEAKRQVLIKKQQAAKREVFLAINEYCANFLRNPSSDVESLFESYQTAKQKALEFYPQIVNQVYQATVMDRENGQEVNLNQTIQAWFAHCEAAFQPPQTQDEPPPVGPIPMISMSPANLALIEKEGPRPPSIPEQAEISITEKPNTETDSLKTKETTATGADHTTENIALLETQQQNTPLLQQPTENEKEEVLDDTEEEIAEDDMADTDDEEYTDADYERELQEEFQKVIATLSGERLTILKKEGRVPDYVDHDDGVYHQAKIWQYEEEEGNRCQIYIFKGNKLSQSKTEMEECPPFW